jgi:hypothetical protein
MKPSQEGEEENEHNHEFNVEAGYRAWPFIDLLYHVSGDAAVYGQPRHCSNHNPNGVVERRGTFCGK